MRSYKDKCIESTKYIFINAILISTIDRGEEGIKFHQGKHLVPRIIAKRPLDNLIYPCTDVNQEADLRNITLFCCHFMCSIVAVGTSV